MFFFFFNDTATTEIYTLSLHDALPIFAYTAGDLDVWREVMARVMTAAGAHRGDLLHIAFGYGLFTGGLGFHDGAERIGMTVVPASAGNTARHHLLLQDFRPDAIAATPSFALHLAETLTEQGGPAPRARTAPRPVRCRTLDGGCPRRARAGLRPPRV